MFARFLASEIKHGRVAMISATSSIAPEFVRFHGYLSTSEAVQVNRIFAVTCMPVSARCRACSGPSSSSCAP